MALPALPADCGSCAEACPEGASHARSHTGTNSTGMCAELHIWSNRTRCTLCGMKPTGRRRGRGAIGGGRERLSGLDALYGVSGTGSVVPAGGLDRYLTLFGAGGNLLASNYRPAAGPPGADSRRGNPLHH